MAMKTDNEALKSLRVRARSNPRVRSLLENGAKRLAQDLVKGQVFGEKELGAIQVRNAQGNPIGWLNGRGNSVEERAAYARAILRIAEHRISTGEVQAKAIDRVEYAARAVAGKRQGQRLTDAEVQQIKAKQETTDEVEFLVQTLVHINAAAPAAAFVDFTVPQEKGMFDIPEVELSELNFHSEDDDLRANEERSRSDNRDWAILKIDGEVVGLTRTFGNDDRPDVDNAVDPNGTLRYLDQEYPLSADDVAWRREKDRAFQAYKQRCLEAKEAARREEGWARLSPEKAAAARAQYEQRTAAFAAKRREEALARAAAAEASAAKLQAAKAEEQAYLEQFSVKGSSQRAEVLKVGQNYSDDPVVSDEQLTDSEIRDILAVVEDASIATYNRAVVLDEETVEVSKSAFDDSMADPLTVLDLLEETAAEFHGTQVADSDLGVEKALRAVPGLANHVRKLKGKMPKGLLGALAFERAKHTANQKRQAAMLDGFLALEKALV